MANAGHRPARGHCSAVAEPEAFERVVGTSTCSGLAGSVRTLPHARAPGPALHRVDGHPPAMIYNMAKARVEALSVPRPARATGSPSAAPPYSRSLSRPHMSRAALRRDSAAQRTNPRRHPQAARRRCRQRRRAAAWRAPPGRRPRLVDPRRVALSLSCRRGRSPSVSRYRARSRRTRPRLVSIPRPAAGARRGRAGTGRVRVHEAHRPDRGRGTAREAAGPPRTPARGARWVSRPPRGAARARRRRGAPAAVVRVQARCPARRSAIPPAEGGVVQRHERRAAQRPRARAEVVDPGGYPRVRWAGSAVQRRLSRTPATSGRRRPAVRHYPRRGEPTIAQSNVSTPTRPRMRKLGTAVPTAALGSTALRPTSVRLRLRPPIGSRSKPRHFPLKARRRSRTRSPARSRRAGGPRMRSAMPSTADEPAASGRALLVLARTGETSSTLERRRDARPLLGALTSVEARGPEALASVDVGAEAYTGARDREVATVPRSVTAEAPPSLDLVGDGAVARQNTCCSSPATSWSPATAACTGSCTGPARSSPTRAASRCSRWATAPSRTRSRDALASTARGRARSCRSTRTVCASAPTPTAASASWARRPRWRSRPRWARTSRWPSTSARRFTSREYTERSTERTHRWLVRCLDWHAAARLRAGWSTGSSRAACPTTCAAPRPRRSPPRRRRDRDRRLARAGQGADVRGRWVDDRGPAGGDARATCSASARSTTSSAVSSSASTRSTARCRPGSAATGWRSCPTRTSAGAWTWPSPVARRATSR